MIRHHQKLTSAIIEVARLLLIILFVYAAVTKLMVYNKFIVQVGLSPMLPRFFTPVAWTIPVIELIVAILLVFNKTLKAGLYASNLLMLIFTLYITGILTIAKHIPCSCGGVLEKLSWGQHLVVNIGYLLLAGAALFLYEKRERFEGQADNLYES